MNALAPKPLTIICRHCAGEGSEYRSRYGGNDPDVWRVGPCDFCDQTGYEILCCDGCDDPEAVEWFGGHKWCAKCAAEAKADALHCGEDAS